MTDLTTTDLPPAQPGWQYLISLVDRPRMTFAGVLAHPRGKWVLPVILAVVAILVSVWASAPYTSELGRTQARQRLAEMELSPEQMEAALAQTERTSSPLFIGIVGSIGGLVTIGLLWTLSTVFFYYASMLGGAETKFGQIFLVVIWANLANSLRALVQGLLILVTGRFPIYTSLAALQVSGDVMADAGNPLIPLLNLIDPFWLWHLALLIIGLAVATGFSRKKTLLLVLLYTALTAALSILPSFLVGLQ